MLHHKHFDCNYGAMHVPLGGWTAHCVSIDINTTRPPQIISSEHTPAARRKSNRSGAVNRLARRPTTPLCTWPAPSRTRWSERTPSATIFTTKQILIFVIWWGGRLAWSIKYKSINWLSWTEWFSLILFPLNFVLKVFWAGIFGPVGRTDQWGLRPLQPDPVSANQSWVSRSSVWKLKYIDE